jgi:predicted NUDIX family NTP pyrophosphohydrolase
MVRGLATDRSLAEFRLLERITEMAARSAGILMHQRRNGALVVLLVHPGGPFWAKKDHGAWSIPKGEYSPEEDSEAAARREFEEELGLPAIGPLTPLGEIVQKAGKRVIAFALEGDLDTAAIRSNTCEIEWPPRSGKLLTIPEIDRAEWFSLEEARRRIIQGQLPFLDRLAALCERAG